MNDGTEADSFTAHASIFFTPREALYPYPLPLHSLSSLVFFFLGGRGGGERNRTRNVSDKIP
jgi:hypothetical protein